MSIVKIPTHFNIDVEFEVPEFYRRFLAWAIDGLIQYFYLRIIQAFLSGVAGNRYGYSSDDMYNMWGMSLLLFFPVLCYHLLMEITMNGQSPGKKITGIRVVNENGGRPSLSQFLIRWFLRDTWFVLLFFMATQTEQQGSRAESVFIYLFVLAYFITDLVLVVVSRKGQRLGDILARTLLIRTHTRSNIEETVFMEVADNYVPSFPQIMQLSDRDINAIKTILESARRKGDYPMAETAAHKIKSHLKIESGMPAFDFLDVLLRDYNYLSTK